MQQIEYERVFDHFDGGVGPHRGDERALHLEPRRVAAGMNYPIAGVPALAGEGEIAAVRRPVERGA